MEFPGLYHKLCEGQTQTALSTRFSQLRGGPIHRPDQAHFAEPYLGLFLKAKEFRVV
jgi:hypothetical protein